MHIDNVPPLPIGRMTAEQYRAARDDLDARLPRLQGSHRQAREARGPLALWLFRFERRQVLFQHRNNVIGERPVFLFRERPQLITHFIVEPDVHRVETLFVIFCSHADSLAIAR
jgi:hypothetical protein